MSISEPFIRRPIATTLLAGALALLGIVTFPLLPIAPLPQVDFPTISVSVQLAGASPDTMAATVAAPLERQFGQIAGVTQMTSASTLGSTSITLQFELNRNVDAAAQDVQAAITAASRQLPLTLTAPPTYRKVNPADSPILILAVHSDSMPITQVDDFADNVIAQQISQITGVAQVIIGGEQKPAIRVQVDPAKLQTRGLTLEDVRGVIANATTNAAKGAINTDRQSFTIQANDQLLQADPSPPKPRALQDPTATAQTRQAHSLHRAPTRNREPRRERRSHPTAPKHLLAVTTIGRRQDRADIRSHDAEGTPLLGDQR